MFKSDGRPDLQFANLGAVARCRALSGKGLRWLRENVAASQAVASDTIQVPTNEARNLAATARADGLVCLG